MAYSGYRAETAKRDLEIFKDKEGLSELVFNLVIDDIRNAVTKQGCSIIITNLNDYVTISKESCFLPRVVKLKIIKRLRKNGFKVLCLYPTFNTCIWF